MTRSLKPRACASILFCIALCAQSAPAAAQVAVPSIDSIFADWNRSDGPGGAVAVLRDGEIVLERGYGSAQLEHRVPVTPSTGFHVASVTKQFTAAGIVLLARQGRLSLDDEVRKHLPEMPDLGAPVTIRQLIHHTSGVRDQWELLAIAGWRLDDVITKDQILRTMWRQRELNFEPNSEHLYSNMGYTLLAEIVGRVGGAPFPEWMHQNVFAPLGMNSTHMHDDHEHLVPGRAYSYRGRGGRGGGEGAPVWRNAVLSYANAGATSLFTTASDLARWLRNFETERVGGPGFTAQMRQRGVLSSGDTLPYAFAVVRGERRGRTIWSHSGSDAGFRSYVVHVPDERLGVVVLSNDAGANPSRLALAVVDAYLGESQSEQTAQGGGGRGRRGGGPGQPARAPLTAAQLQQYAGDYFSPELETIYRIRVAGDTLVASHARHGDTTLRHDDDDQFVGGRLNFNRAAFTRGPDGRVDGFRLSGSRVRNLRFVRLPTGALQTGNGNGNGSGSGLNGTGAGSGAGAG